MAGRSSRWLSFVPKAESRQSIQRLNLINGAEAGQVLTVHIDEIETEPFGFTRFRGQIGAMPGWLGGNGIGYHERVVQIVDNHII